MDTGWQLRNHNLIGNWFAYDVDGDLFIDGDGTKRSILARFVAEENICPPLLVPNYKKAHIDWDAFNAHERISSLLGVGSVSWYQKPRHVWFETGYLSQGKVYDIVELADWLERRETTTGWRKYMFSVTNRLESKT